MNKYPKFQFLGHFRSHRAFWAWQVGFSVIMPHWMRKVRLKWPHRVRKVWKLHFTYRQYILRHTKKKYWAIEFLRGMYYISAPVCNVLSNIHSNICSNIHCSNVATFWKKCSNVATLKKKRSNHRHEFYERSNFRHFRKSLRTPVLT